MTRPGRRRLAVALGLTAWAVLSPAAARAQAADCAALQARIDAAGRDADPARADAEMRRQRDAILQARSAADRTGCGDGVFDEPDSPPCRAVARRIGLMEVDLQRLQDRASSGDPGDGEGRRALQDRFDAECSAVRADDAPVTVMPVDPDAPPGPAAKPKAAQVLCVRHCDGAFYPLAVDVAADRMPDMDRLCQAQCPAAESSAYAGDGDVAGAVASDGSNYSALPTAFGYLKGPSKACACRGPRQTWAEALAGAEALLEPHKGDVTVTAELAAAMARPAAVKGTPAAQPASAAPPRKGKRAPPPLLVPAPAPEPGRDLTREFRGSGPTL